MKKKIIIACLIILFFSLIYCYLRFGATSGLKVKEYGVNANIPESFNGLKIVHFSDLLMGSTINDDDLENIVNKINFIKPDIVVFTGDLISNYDKDISIQLNKINSRLGKYAVRGDYDNDKFNDIMKKSGFIVLNNSYELIYNESNEPILISGTKNIDETFNKNAYKILLTHEVIDAEYDLILAGHSHHSQINIKNFQFNYEKNNSKTFISSGLGTTKYNLRLFNKPSINFYRMKKST